MHSALCAQVCGLLLVEGMNGAPLVGNCIYPPTGCCASQDGTLLQMAPSLAIVCMFEAAAAAARSCSSRRRACVARGAWRDCLASPCLSRHCYYFDFRQALEKVTFHRMRRWGPHRASERCSEWDIHDIVRASILYDDMSRAMQGMALLVAVSRQSPSMVIRTPPSMNAQNNICSQPRRVVSPCLLYTSPSPRDRG